MTIDHFQVKSEAPKPSECPFLDDFRESDCMSRGKSRANSENSRGNKGKLGVLPEWRGYEYAIRT